MGAARPLPRAAVKAERFRSVFRLHPAGVAVVTCDPGDGPSAMTVSSVISVSADPPTIAASFSTRSSATARFLEARTAVVHMVSRDDLDLVKAGASSGADRFGPGTEWARLATGEPFYAGVGTRIRVSLGDRLIAGDATIVAMRVLDLVAPPEEADPRAVAPVVYWNRAWIAHYPTQALDAG